MLAVENRNSEDSRSIGELFFLSFDELQDVKFSEALKMILDLLQETLQELLFLTEDQIELFIDTFISKLPQYISRKMSYVKSA